jgi:formylglycine-generating enzyme required for sulfatase activity
MGDSQFPLFTGGKDGRPMVAVPAGEFLCGPDRAKASTGAFYIDRYPVTNAEYQKFVQATGAEEPAHWRRGAWPEGKADHPVVQIKWDSTNAYAKWAGKRLPTELEWEKAARGTKGWTYPWGNDWAVPERRCNASGKDDGYEFTAPVGACGGASPFGCFDMVGNVREWCLDDYTTKTGTKVLVQGKVLRGGSFLAREYNTTTMRESEPPLHTSATVGFRCVMDERK